MYRTEDYLIRQGRNIPMYYYPKKNKYNVSQDESIKNIKNIVEQRNNPQPAIKTFVNLDILNSDLPDYEKNRMNKIYNQMGEAMFDEDKYKHSKKSSRSSWNSMPVNDGAIPLKNFYKYEPAMTEIEKGLLLSRNIEYSDFGNIATTQRDDSAWLMSGSQTPYENDRDPRGSDIKNPEFLIYPKGGSPKFEEIHTTSLEKLSKSEVNQDLLGAFVTIAPLRSPMRTE